MYIDKTIPRNLRSQIERELDAGEQIRWVEIPIPRYFTAGSTSAFLFAIPWTAFAIFWMFGASGFQMPDFDDAFDLFPLFGVPFVLIGLGMLSSPLWAYRKSTKTVYVITNKRAITFDGGTSTTIRSYPPNKLTDIYRKEKSDGTGDVIISSKAWKDSDGDRHSEELGFLRILKPKEVEKMLNTLAKEHHSAES